jgi:hypothetical protein
MAAPIVPTRFVRLADIADGRRDDLLMQLGENSLTEIYLWAIHRYHREHTPPPRLESPPLSATRCSSSCNAPGLAAPLTAEGTLAPC